MLTIVLESMGLFCSRQKPLNEADADENAQALEIERRIAQETKFDRHIHKLLLLGAGESGKSTIFKQIRLLFQTGFDDTELRSYTSVIHANVFQTIKILYDGAKELAQNEAVTSKFEVSHENKGIGEKLSEIGGRFDYPRLTKDLARDIQKLWNDAAIEATYSRGNMLQVPDCAQYFMENLQRLSDVNYVPTKVFWTPYTDEIRAHLPANSLEGEQIWRAEVPLIYFHIVEYYYPDRFKRQFGGLQGIPKRCSTFPELHAIDLRGKVHVDWRAKHSLYIARWEEREVRTIRIDQSRGVFATPEYEQWYGTITRRFIGRLGATLASNEDVLHARVRTTGVVEIQFSPVGEHKRSGEVYRLFDVGGQKNERRKWIHLFEGVTAVIFCAAISEYDQMLFEDETKNRMMETKELFDWVLKQPCFEKTSFVLFLNKFDIFEKKILKVPLNVCDWFKDYRPMASGKQEVEHAYEFVKKKFEELYFQRTGPDRVDRTFKVYRTTALDQKLIKKTFKLVDETLRRRNLIEAGLL